MTNAHDRCSRALRDLRFDWIQDPEVVLDTDMELFKVFHKKLHLGLERKYYPLLTLVTPTHLR